MTLNHCSLSDIKRLYIRFANVYGPRFTAIHTSKEIIEMWHIEWHDALLGIDRELVLEAFNECKMHSEWPPSIAQIIQCCDEKLGLPSIYDCITKAINQDFSHPVVEKIHDRIGHWALHNETEKQLITKAKKYYTALVGEFRMNRQRRALGLEHKLKEVKHDSQGSEIARNNSRGNGVRKVEGFVL